VTLVGIGDEPRSPRRLRLRADAQLAERLGPAEAGDEIARLRIPCRDAVAPGDRIVIEISFGAMVDEIELDGRVVASMPNASGGPPTLVLAVDPAGRAPLEYLRGVLGGLRSPSARAHRRIPVDLVVQWRCGELRQQTRARDLSRGGAFILSHLQPPIGSSLEIEFEGGAHSPFLRVAAVVSWIQRQGGAAGFGVRFQIRSREEADQLQRMVRAQTRPGELTDR
jgi:hypothetical protein